MTCNFYNDKANFGIYSGGWNTAGISNAFGISMVALCLVFIWHSALNKMAAILSKTIKNPHKIAAILFWFLVVWLWNGLDHSYSYCYDRQFQNLLFSQHFSIIVTCPKQDSNLGSTTLCYLNLQSLINPLSHHGQIELQNIWYSNVRYSSPFCM